MNVDIFNNVSYVKIEFGEGYMVLGTWMRFPIMCFAIDSSIYF